MTFKANNTNVAVSTTTDGVTVTGNIVAGTTTLTLSGVTTSTENVVITFTNSKGSNVRIDDIVLKGAQIALTKVATPVISPASGAVVTGTEVSITCATDGATIYYTTDGSTPTSSSETYNPANKPTITTNCTIKAIGIKNEWDDSDVASASYTIAEPCATPTFSVAAGEVDKGTTVEISTATEGATIYYTTTGDDPTTSSTVYSSAITINSALTLKAIAVKEGNANSAVATAAYTVRDYATLPFAFDGGRADIETITGLSQENLDSDYSSSPKLKFKTTGTWVILKLDEAPTSLSYDIKGNSFSGGTFDVLTSTDGTNYQSLATYTELGATQSITHINLNSGVRYIKWIYTEKSNGNVALGNIHATTQYDIYGTASTASLEPTASKKCTIYNGGVLTVSGTLTNNSPANLTIADGAQLIANNAVNATLQKEIAGFGSDNTVKTGWYTIASPLTTAVAPASNILANTYDLYYYDEADFKWYNYKPNNAHSGFSIEPNKGYLYANSENTTISFSGVMRASNANVSIPLSYASSTENAKGFNLVGNPFTFNLTNSSNITLGGTSISTYYIADGTVNNEGKNLIAYNIADRPIKPGEGFFVQATAADQSLVFNGRGRGEQNAYIRILAGNENFIDRAYVQFGGGNTLRKMTLSDNTAKVYVMQDNKDYAAAIIEKAQGEMPVNFKASANGTYTVTVNPEGVELNYLHLIDNMTGMDVDLLQTPSYTFDATTNDYASRFRLVFSANGMNENGKTETFAFFSNGNWVVSNEGEATLQVIDVNGRIVSNETINGTVATSINATPGVYMLRLVNGNEVKTQKIVVK